MSSLLPPIQQARNSLNPPITAPKAAPKAAPPKDIDAIKNPVNILKLSYNDLNETKLKLLKKSITNINYNLLYFLSHDINDGINFYVNSDNLLSLFVSKNKIILYDIYHFINTRYREKFLKFLVIHNKHITTINLLYNAFELNARKKILGSRYYLIVNPIKTEEKSMRSYIKRCINDLKDTRDIIQIDFYFNSDVYFEIDYTNDNFKIYPDYDKDKKFDSNIQKYIETNKLSPKDKKINNLIEAIKKLNKFKKFYDYIFNNDTYEIIKFNEKDYDSMYKTLNKNYISTILEIELHIKDINEFFNNNINKIISSNNIFKYEDNYKKKFDDFILNIKNIYNIKITKAETIKKITLDFLNFVKGYNILYKDSFNYDLLSKRFESFEYIIPTFSIESEFYKENKVIEADTYNISIPYNQKIINYNVRHIYNYKFLLKSIFYIDNVNKSYNSFYTKHQILWALIQNTFLIFNEIINILLYYLSQSDYSNEMIYDEDYFTVIYKLGIDPLVINEISIDIKNMNIVFNNLIFIFIIPRLMLISKIYNHHGNTLDDFLQSTDIKLYYFEDFF